MVLGAILLAVVVGTTVGVIAAIRRGAVDSGLQVVSTFVQAVPGFLVALFLALIFAVQLGLLPGDGLYIPDHIAQ